MRNINTVRPNFSWLLEIAKQKPLSPVFSLTPNFSWVLDSLRIPNGFNGF